MKDYRLVGLNGLNDIGEIGMDEPCFELSATDSTPDISIIQDMSVWAHILNADPKTNALVKPEKRKEFGTENYDNPLYFQLRGGGPFRDKFGNTIFIRFKEWGLPQRMYDLGYYGEHSDIIHVVRHWDRSDDFSSQGAGWMENWVRRFRAKNDYNYIMKELEQVGINKRKLHKPVMFYIDRGDVIAIDEYTKEIIEAMNIIALATAFFPAIGPFVAGAIGAAAQMVNGFIKNGNLDLSVSNVAKMGSAFLPEGSPISSYINDGAELADAIENKNYQHIGNILGYRTNQLDAITLPEKLRDNDISSIVKRSDKTFDEIHKITQAAKNSLIPGQMHEAMTMTEIQMQMIEDDLSGDSWANIFEMIAGGGYPVLPTIKGDGNGTEDLMAKAISAHKTEIYDDPNLHKALMNMAMGMPIDPNTFDNYLMANYESKLSGFTSTPFKKQADFTLPAGISPAKRECFARHLRNKGIDILLGDPTAMEQEKKIREEVKAKYSGNKVRKVWK